MAKISPEQVVGYLDRWNLVREWETQELRNVSMEIKLRQLAVLMASRQLFEQDDETRDLETDAVRRRWQQIRKVLRD